MQVATTPKLVALAVERGSVTRRLVERGWRVLGQRARPVGPGAGAAVRETGGRGGAGWRRGGGLPAGGAGARGGRRPSLPDRRRWPGWPARCARSSGGTLTLPRRRPVTFCWSGEVVDAGEAGGRGAGDAARCPGAPHGGHPDELRGVTGGPTGRRPGPASARSQLRGRGGRRSIRRVEHAVLERGLGVGEHGEIHEVGLGLLLNRSRSGPSTGGRPRERTASALARKRSTMASGSNSIGHDPMVPGQPTRYE